MAKIIVSLWCRTVFITDDSAFSDHLFVNLASDIARSIAIKMELNQILKAAELILSPRPAYIITNA